MLTNDSFFAVMLTSVIALFFGFVLSFGGYKFFLILLPIWGFIFGFGLGAQSMQALFGEGFLSTALSWLVGFIFAAMFAFASYFFYFFAVGVVAFALGYTVGVGLLEAIGFNFGLIPWLAGVVLGAAVVVAAFAFNIQKYVVIGATAILGAGVIVGTFLYMFGGLPSAALVANPVRYVLQTSPFWFIVFLVVAGLGAAAQYASTTVWETQLKASLGGPSEESGPPAGSPPPPPTTPPAEPPPPAGQTPPAGQPITG